MKEASQELTRPGLFFTAWATAKDQAPQTCWTEHLTRRLGQGVHESVSDGHGFGTLGLSPLSSNELFARDIRH